MKKVFAIATVLVAVSSSAFAQRGIRYEDEDVTVRIGAGCSLFLYGQRLTGRCTVAREAGSRVSVIKAGAAVYRIVRSPETKYEARFLQVTPSGDSRFVADVIARGNCWIGDGVRFCAE